MNILFTSVGRRVGLIRSFREQASVGDLMVACDVDPTAPGLYEADRAFLVPPVAAPNYLEALCAGCRRFSISLTVPLIDPELPILANARDRLASIGTDVLVSRPDSVVIARNKLATFSFFKSIGIPTPATAPYNPSNDWSAWEFPVILKPAEGSSGRDVIVCHDLEELLFHGARLVNGIVQEKLAGDEVTVDILSDGTGTIHGLGLRKRLKVRAGEVERAVTIRNEAIEGYAESITRHFKPYGAINVQCFLTADGPVFTEINARFGGGYPLSHKAGANFPRRIFSWMRGNMGGKPEIAEAGLVMMRHDTEIFRRLGEIHQ
ncbi:MAG: ATP-grasp domain-containing protein [Bacteroidota bacterium]